MATAGASEMQRPMPERGIGAIADGSFSTELVPPSEPSPPGRAPASRYCSATPFELAKGAGRKYPGPRGAQNGNVLLSTQAWRANS